MRKWKYKIEHVKISVWSKEADRIDPVEEKLTRLGMDGWELVNIIKPSSSSYNVNLYLKRPY